MRFIRTRHTHRIAGLTLSILAAAPLLAHAGAARAQPAQEVTLTVPGTGNLWLSGMPAGTWDGNPPLADSAPAQSPAEVTGLPLPAGGALTFFATGLVTYDPQFPGGPPDGLLSGPAGAHNRGAANGIARVAAPGVALLGVFLGEDRPDLTPAPPDTLNFFTEASRNYTSLSPLLKQPFFIGDGRDALGRPQQVIIPDGAARLFLGPSDSIDWYNNGGAFTVTAAVVPEPAATAPAAAAAVLLLSRRRRRC